LSLLFIVGWILFEAVNRFLEPTEVLGKTMLIVAAAGLVVNLIAFAVLHGGDQDNLNIRGAVIHVAGDLLGSMAAIIAALVIIYTGWMPIDPILSVAVAMLILRSAWILVKRSSHVLLEGAPEWLDTQTMQDKIIGQVPAVCGVHHVHVWGMTPQELMLTMHVRLEAEPGNPTECIRQIKDVLRAEYGIGHSTIEIETDDCADH
jgi:cobalt-zinc-cadmium efflux system protein